MPRVLAGREEWHQFPLHTHSPCLVHPPSFLVPIRYYSTPFAAGLLFISFSFLSLIL